MSSQAVSGICFHSLRVRLLFSTHLFFSFRKYTRSLLILGGPTSDLHRPKQSFARSMDAWFIFQTSYSLSQEIQSRLPIIGSPQLRQLPIVRLADASGCLHGPMICWIDHTAILRTRIWITRISKHADQLNFLCLPLHLWNADVYSTSETYYACTVNDTQIRTTQRRSVMKSVRICGLWYYVLYLEMGAQIGVRI